MPAPDHANARLVVEPDDNRRPAASTFAMICLAPVALLGFFQICCLVIGVVAQCVSWLWLPASDIAGPLFSLELGLTSGHLWMLACLISFDAILSGKRSRWVYHLTAFSLLWTASAGIMGFFSDVIRRSQNAFEMAVSVVVVVVAAWFILSPENRRHYQH